MSDLEGAILSEYLLLKCVSRGGTADVYRARPQGGEGYGGEVAVKVFRPGYAQRKSFREYFMAEAEKVGQLDHPNILPFLEFGEGDGLLYTVTPLVPTGTLEDLLGHMGGRFSAMQALPIMQQLCSAVQFAHDHDVIHGNMKPTNIFIAADGRVLLADFAIARGYDDSQQSLTGIGWGLAEYAAPEQSLGVLRRSSDIYTLGVLLFRILTGQPPFTGQTPVEILLKHVRQQPPSARGLAPTISDTVDAVLLMAMQKRSDDRFSSAKEFSDALSAAVAPVASSLATPATVARQSPVQFSSLGDPQTPLPVELAPTQRITPPVSLEPPHLATFMDTPPERERLKGAPQAPLRAPTDGFPTTAGGNGNTGGRSNFLVDDNDSGTSLFEWVGPIEWSPIGNGNALPTPTSASEYLRSMPMAPVGAGEELSGMGLPAPQEEHPMRGIDNQSSRQHALGRDSIYDSPTGPINRTPTQPPPAQPTKSGTKGTNTSSSLLHQVLPVVVVILLLLGLLAALLSSFLYSGGGTHGNIPGHLRQVIEGMLWQNL